MSKIKKAWSELGVGRYVQGTNVVKGDYIERPRIIRARDNNGQIHNLSSDKIRNAYNIKRITQKLLDEKLRGRDVNEFRDTEL